MVKVNRREFLKKLTVFGVGCLGVGVASFPRRRISVFREARPLMGTVAEVCVMCEKQERAREALEGVFSLLESLERRWSVFQKDSEISRANREAFVKDVVLKKDTAWMVERALFWAGELKGTYDPAMGKWIAAWKSFQVPKERGGREFWKKVSLKGQKLRFLDQETSLDLGSVAKGFAIDVAKDWLYSQNLEAFLINLGGDIGGFGERDWHIGVLDPKPPHRVVRQLILRNQVVATSGNYFQYFRKKGRIYHHLIHPLLGRPVPEHFQSVTVVCDRGVDADILSTGLFFWESHQAKQWVKAHLDYGWYLFLT